MPDLVPNHLVTSPNFATSITNAVHHPLHERNNPQILDGDADVRHNYSEHHVQHLIRSPTQQQHSGYPSHLSTSNHDDQRINVLERDQGTKIQNNECLSVIS